MCRCKKYCAAQVVMLRTVLDMRFSEIMSITKIPSNALGSIIWRAGLAAEKPKSKNDVDLDAMEREYIEGASTYELGKKYSVRHETVSRWMRERGHSRGRHQGPAFEKSRQKQHEAAKRHWLEELDDISNGSTGKRPRQVRREAKIASRPHDRGINWRALAKRNGSMRCEICGIECDPNDRTWGTSGPTHPSVDHITRICDGGTDTWDNVRLACVACNLKLNIEKRKEVRDAEEQSVA